MNVEVEKFWENGVIVVAIPAHLSHILQPLDVTCFRGVKNSTRALIKEMSEVTAMERYSTRKSISLKQIVDSSILGISKGCSETNIRKGFEQTGIWPLNPAAFNQFPIVKDHTSNSMLSKSEFLHKFSGYKHQMKYSYDCVTIHTGFIDTTKGALLTSAKAISTIKKSMEKEFLSDDEYSK